MSYCVMDRDWAGVGHRDTGGPQWFNKESFNHICRYCCLAAMSIHRGAVRIHGENFWERRVYVGGMGT